MLNCHPSPPARMLFSNRPAPPLCCKGHNARSLSLARSFALCATPSLPPAKGCWGGRENAGRANHRPYHCQARPDLATTQYELARSTSSVDTKHSQVLGSLPQCCAREHSLSACHAGTLNCQQQASFAYCFPLIYPTLVS